MVCLISHLDLASRKHLKTEAADMSFLPANLLFERLRIRKVYFKTEEYKHNIDQENLIRI